MKKIENVLIVGAGGPLGAIITQELSRSYTLRLADIRPLSALLKDKPQSSGAPLPRRLASPHEWVRADVRSSKEMDAVCSGIDAVINCSVIRTDPTQAYSVNALGVYNLLRAAVKQGVRRVIQTGPNQFSGSHPYAKSYENNVYRQSKLLGEKIARGFAEDCDMEVIALRFGELLSRDRKDQNEKMIFSLTAFIGVVWNKVMRNRAGVPSPTDLCAFSVSWDDAAKAVRLALEVKEPPRRFCVADITAASIGDVFSNRMAKEILGGEPETQ